MRRRPSSCARGVALLHEREEVCRPAGVVGRGSHEGLLFLVGDASVHGRGGRVLAAAFVLTALSWLGCGSSAACRLGLGPGSAGGPGGAAGSRRGRTRKANTAPSATTQAQTSEPRLRPATKARSAAAMITARVLAGASAATWRAAAGDCRAATRAGAGKPAPCRSWARRRP